MAAGAGIARRARPRRGRLAEPVAAAGFLAASLVAAPALAQTAALPKKAAPPASQSIVVTGNRPEVSVGIDRKSYEVGRDLQGATGSIADVLRNIPSVDVDLNGNVTLRGQGGVTILVDGRPASLFSGPAGGQTLQQTPATQYERVEVMTNPSAAFSAEGTGGIINLVTRANRTRAFTASLRANLGTRGRRSASGSLADRFGKLGASGAFTWRGDPQFSTNVDRFTYFDSAGRTVRRDREVTRGVGNLHLWTVKGSVDYPLDPISQLTADLHHTTFDYHSNMRSELSGTDSAGAAVRSFERDGLLVQNRSDSEGSLSFRRDYGKTRKLTASLTYEATLEDNRQAFSSRDLVPPAPRRFENVTRRNRLHRFEAKGDYSNGFGKERLETGWDLEMRNDRFADLGGFGPDPESAAFPDPAFSETIRFRRSVGALYATYQREFGKLTAQVGARAELSSEDLKSAGSGFRLTRSGFGLFPSVNAQYRIGDFDVIRSSLSTRIGRPDAEDLDPFRRFIDPFHFSAGNPALKDQRTVSAELGFEHERGKSLDELTFYYRRSRHGVTDISTDLGGGVLLSERANLRGSRSAGAELIFNGRLTRTVSYRLSGNVYHYEIDASNLGFSKRSAWIESGKAGLDWQPDAKDFLQAAFTLAGKRLVPQGSIDPMLLVNLGFRHQFSKRLWAFVTAQDALHTYQQHGIVRTATLSDRSDASAKTQAAFVGLSVNFGGPRKGDPAFDFSS